MARILCTLFMLVGLATASFAQQVSDADSAEFERIITEQLNAFKADDGPKAYSYAAPNIKSIFPTSDLFMAMVRQGYPQVYRPQSYKFTGALLDPAGRPSQKVLFIGPNGKAHMALYTMQKQPDGTWKIAACAIIQELGLDA